MRRNVNPSGKPGWGKRACVVLALYATAATALPAQTFTTLHSFDGTDGANPLAGLVQAADGNFYGTTNYGGANFCPPSGCGSVFRISPSGTLTTLYSFCSQRGCADGANPQAGLVQSTGGSLYGTALAGGASGHGTVFKITPSGTLTVLYTFCPQGGQSCTDGAGPYAGLALGTNGDFYGTTEGGGANGAGTVFKITPSGTLTTVYSFCSKSACADGASPYAGLLLGTNGDFYGTVVGGGANGYGTIFKITPSGALTTVYSFCSKSVCADGGSPYGGLVQANSGDLYGTTYTGPTGTNCNGGGCGTIFKITLSGTLTTLYSFCHQFDCPDGAGPYAGLVLGTNGDFYGTTVGGGISSSGTIFQITKSGTLTTLYSFCSVEFPCADGEAPFAGLVQGTNGMFYGTALWGGSNACQGGCGTIFSLSVGLGPFVKTQPISGKIGAAVKILGTELTGATSVTFNGTAAAFTVVSSSLITTTVPAGATTGKITVATPSGTLSSNVPFRVP